MLLHGAGLDGLLNMIWQYCAFIDDQNNTTINFRDQERRHKS